MLCSSLTRMLQIVLLSSTSLCQARIASKKDIAKLGNSAHESHQESKVMHTMPTLLIPRSCAVPLLRALGGVIAGSTDLTPGWGLLAWVGLACTVEGFGLRIILSYSACESALRAQVCSWRSDLCF